MQPCHPGVAAWRLKYISLNQSLHSVSVKSVTLQWHNRGGKPRAIFIRMLTYSHKVFEHVKAELEALQVSLKV